MLSVAAVSFIIGLFIMLIGRPASVFLCLLPFRHAGLRTKTFVSWVGLRGAVPIIFATYPWWLTCRSIADIQHSIFCHAAVARNTGHRRNQIGGLLGLIDHDAKDRPDFGVELSEEHTTSLRTLVLTPRHLSEGNTLGSISLPEGGLVIMIRRDGRYIVPNGKRRLQAGDTLPDNKGR